MSYAYDTAGRLVEQALPDERVIAYEYDRNGNPVAVTPPSRPAHSFAHDDVDRVGSYTPPDLGAGAQPASYSYDHDGAVTAIDRPGSLDLAFGYDSAGRLDEITEPGAATTTLTYDGSTGQLEQLAAPGGVDTNLSYDGVLPTGIETSGPVAGAVTATYNNELGVSAISVNGSNPASYSYDEDGLITGAGDLELDRSPETGQPTGFELDTIAGAMAYDGFGDPASIAHERAGTGLYSVDYTRDELGRVTSVTEDDGSGAETWSYGYDAAGRLVDVDRNGSDYAAYAYDANGNRVTVSDSSGTTSASYDVQDRMTDRGVFDYAYTADGTLEAKTNTQTSAVTDFDYDALGNLDGVSLPNGDEIDYLTDGIGRRVAKKVNGTLEQGFLYGPGATGPLAELDGQGNVRSRFVYATSPIVPDYMIKGGATYRIITNGLGSPELVVDAATGAVAQRLDYGPFGEVLSDSNPGFQPFGFAGGLYDPDTGLTRFGARDYDADSGRWTAKDPIGFAGGQANLYGYVLNDPVNLVDPSGLSVIPGLDLGPVDDVTGAGARTIGEFDDVITNGDAWEFGQNEALGVVHAWSLGLIDAPCPGAGYGTGQVLGAACPRSRHPPQI